MVIRRIEEREREQVVIECVEVTKEVDDIRGYALARGTELTGTHNERQYRFELRDVLYFEAVDECVFAYTDDRVYEMKARLYELEGAYADRRFLRCSKSFIINLMKLESISPALNGRMTAHMKNSERVMVSRQYVKALKHALLGGA